MTNRIPRLLVGALALVAACSSDATAPQLDVKDSAALAAEVFEKMADSVSRVGGDPDVGGAYGALADVVRRGGRVSPITITVDGVATSFVATAVISVMDRAPCTGTVCAAIPTTMQRSLIAWDRDNPKRVVQLSSTSDSEPIDAVLYPTLLAVYAPMASLIYLDGKGGTYFGTSGVQKFSVVTKSAVPCAPVSAQDAVKSLVSSTCTQADIAVSFTGKLEPSRFLVANNTATGTHTLAMPPQTVFGSYHRYLAPPPCDTKCDRPPVGPDSGVVKPQPPIVVRPSAELPATLTAKLDSGVTFTLTVRNPSTSPIKVDMNGPRADFVVTDSSTRKEVWRWSTGKFWTLEYRSPVEIAAGASFSISATWAPALRGRYQARGYLTSVTHRSEAYASVVVP